jgi:predicted acylesterase/phospholipase RssA
LGPKFSNDAKIDLANEAYGDTAFGDLLLPVLIPTYSITESRANLFTNWSQDSANINLAALVVAATSPPSIFPAVQLQGDSAEAGEYIDGAVLVNNPAHLAMIHALDRFPDARFVIVSVGSGLRNGKITSLDAIYDGALRWLKPLLIIMFDGRDEFTSLMLEKVSCAKTELGIQHYRFNRELPLGRGSFVDTSPENLEDLKVLGQELIEKEQEKLKEVIELLQ